MSGYTKRSAVDGDVFDSDNGDYDVVKYIWMSRYTNRSLASSLRTSKSLPLLIFLEKKI